MGFRAATAAAGRRGAAAALALLLGACAAPGESPLTIAYRWTPPGARPSPIQHPLRNQAPDLLLIRWNPAEISGEDVDFVAERQCLAWNRRYRLVGEATSDGFRVARFACDLPLVSPDGNPAGSRER